MRNLLNIFSICVFVVLFSFCLIGCGASSKNDGIIAEKVESGKVVFNEIEFENAESVKVKQDNKVVVVSGDIDKLSDAQKSIFGQDEVSHAVVLKYVFDKERTIESFEIKGEKTKVFSIDDKVENYAGSISSLLDSGAGEDAYAYLILSAETKEYKLTARYSDESESAITVKIKATLVSASAD